MSMQLAQANFARFREAMGSALSQEFIALVDPVNQIADRSPGFVWRLPPADGHVLSTPAGGDRRDVVNVSVWESYEHLHAFVSQCTRQLRPSPGALVRAVRSTLNGPVVGAGGGAAHRR